MGQTVNRSGVHLEFSKEQLGDGTSWPQGTADDLLWMCKACSRNLNYVWKTAIAM